MRTVTAASTRRLLVHTRHESRAVLVLVLVEVVVVVLLVVIDVVVVVVAMVGVCSFPLTRLPLLAHCLFGDLLWLLFCGLPSAGAQAPTSAAVSESFGLGLDFWFGFWFWFGVGLGEGLTPVLGTGVR